MSNYYDIESQTRYPRRSYVRGPGPSRDRGRHGVDVDVYEMVSLVPHDGSRNGRRPSRAVRFQGLERGEGSWRPERHRERHVHFQDFERREPSGFPDRIRVPYERIPEPRVEGGENRARIPEPRVEAGENRARIPEPRVEGGENPAPVKEPHDGRWVLGRFVAGGLAGATVGVFGSMAGPFWGAQSELDAIRVAVPVGVGLGLSISAIVVGLKKGCCRS